LQDVYDVNSWAPFIVIGLTSGSVYALTALGLVLSYRTSGIFNFSYGAVAAAAAYIYDEFHAKLGLPWWLAAVIVVFGAGPVIGLLFELMARGLDGVSTTSKLVATIGLLLGIESLLVVTFGTQGRPFPSLFPTSTFRLAGVHVGIDQAITVVIGAGATVALYIFLRRTRTGIAMRAVVESPDLVGLTGTSARQVRSVAWIIGASFAAVSGLLLAPITGLDPLILTLLVVQAFSAAAVGAFTSLPLTYAGGLLVGLVYAFSEKIASGPAAHLQWVQGLPASSPFIILFLVLLFSPAGRLREAGSAVVRQGISREPRFAAGRPAGIAIISGLAIAVPWLVGVRLPVYTNGLSLAILFASLGLLVRTSGQISLAHLAFAAVGGAAMSHLAHGAHLPWLLALLVAGLCAVPVGVVLAIPAIRLSGLYLALATFGFGVLMANLIYPLRFMFGPYQSLPVPRPQLGPIHADNPKAFYFVVLAVAAAVIGSMLVLERSRLGRLLRGLSDSPLALTTRGTNVNATRVLVFGISAFVASIGGAVYASSVGFVSISTYPWFNSLVLLAVLFTVGPGTVRSPILASLAYVVLPSYITNARLVEGLPILFGLSAVLVSMQPFDTSGLKARLARRAAAWAPRTERSPAASRVPVLPALLAEVDSKRGRLLAELAGLPASDERERVEL
jgi:branched-subunit amino acid ABC-type transport system permease component